jgi:Domain of unknown function (DUF4190)/GYF domain 2
MQVAGVYSMSEESIWFYSPDGVRKHGPVTIIELLDLFRRGALSRASLVWQPDFGDWMRIDEVKELDAVNTGNPPPLPRADLQQAGQPSPAPIAAHTVNFQTVLEKKKGLAIAGLICAIIGGYVSVVAIPAVVCGHMALSRIKNYPNEYSGKGMAIAGLILGYLGIALGAMVAYANMTLKATLENMNYP